MEVIKRTSCRAVLLTPENEVLLIKIANPKSDWVGWITPGGGLDEGEEELMGLARELKEELGFHLPTHDVHRVWLRFHRFPWNDQIVQQHEVFYLVKTNKFAPAAETELTESEMLDFKEIRWWRLQEFKTSKETFAPTQFYELLTTLVKNGPPKEAFEIGV